VAQDILDEHNLASLAHALFEEAADALILFVPDTDEVLEANSAAQQLSGFSRQHLLGTSITDLFSCSDKAKQHSLHEAAEGAAIVQSQDGHFLRTSQEGVWIPVNLSVTRLHVQPKTLALLTVRDMRELEQAREKYRRIFENATEGIFQTSPDGRFLTANPALARMLGYADVDDLFAHVTDVARQVHVQPERRAELSRLLETHDAVQGFESLCYKRDGSTIWLCGSVRGVRNAAGELMYYEGILEDITARKRAEEALQARARQQAAVARLGYRALAVSDLTELMSEACGLAAQTLGVEHAAIWELLPSGQELRLRAAVGWRADEPRPLTLASGPGSWPDSVLLGPRPVMIENLLADSCLGAALQQITCPLASAMSVLLPGPDGPFGVIGVFSRQQRLFRDDDAHFLQGIGNVLAAAMERAQAERRRRETEEEFYLARQIQRNLFPAAAPCLPGFDLAALSQSAVATGGEYFDYIPMPYGQVGIAIGDVSGHGFGPALLMASTRAYLRTLAQFQTDVGQILVLANRIIYQDTHGDAFMTLFLGRLDPVARTLVHASAGHLAGYILDAAGREKVHLKSTGIPLGVEPETAYGTASPIQLESGDIVLLLTDGIVEARSPDDEEFGLERCVTTVRSHRDRPAAALVDALHASVTQFCGGKPATDDLTGLIVKVLP
jgi:PAS domain S-box-containing protein